MTPRGRSSGEGASANGAVPRWYGANGCGGHRWVGWHEWVRRAQVGGVVEGKGEARARVTNTNKDKHEQFPFVFAFVRVHDWEVANGWTRAVRDGKGDDEWDGANGASTRVGTECGK